MTCDSYYDTHPPFEGPGDRCSRDEIAAGTATQFSILGMSTTFCGMPIFSDMRSETLTVSRYLEFICDGLDIKKVWTTCRSFGPNLHPCNSSRHTNNRCCGRQARWHDDYPGDPTYYYFGWSSWLHVSPFQILRWLVTY